MQKREKSTKKEKKETIQRDYVNNFVERISNNCLNSFLM